MSSPSLPQDVIDERLRVLAECGGNQSQAAIRLGIGRPALQSTIRRAQALGMAVTAPAVPGIQPPQRAPSAPVSISAAERLLAALRRGDPKTLDQLAVETGLTRGQSLDGTR